MLRTIASSALFCSILLAGTAPAPGLLTARDRQDLGALDRDIAQLKTGRDNSAEAQYRLALAYSYAAEVAMEVHDKQKSEAYAEQGIDPAQKAVAANQNSAEYHRLLGELCGQVIPANPLMGTLKYGPCARDEINKAIQLDSKLALAYVSRGVGNYYLPPSFGGGADAAIKDFDHAIALDPKSEDAYLWKGIALRKANRPAEARQALERAIELDPNRLWTKQELAKIPAH
ncbi:MAG: tetratricopeptide repeat protein [Acidobacteriaceae bacterium]|nr:tetratricopeptide repeat protein [Acidobacteriaceae bacterium]